MYIFTNSPAGVVEPIWEGDSITETYCRCPGGVYGFTCAEGFANPCQNGMQYSAADSRVPNNYFIECNGNIPYLIKCARGTAWNQRILTCDWDRADMLNAGRRGSISINAIADDENALRPAHLESPLSINSILKSEKFR